MGPNEIITLIGGLAVGFLGGFLGARRRDRHCEHPDCHQRLLCPVHSRGALRAIWHRLGMLDAPKSDAAGAKQ